MRFALNGAQAYQDYKNAHSIRLSSWIDLDYDMPVMNGMDSGKLIRKFEPRKDLSPSIIIMISGHCNQSIIEECLDPNGSVRADQFLKKPVSYNHLQEIIKNCT